MRLTATAIVVADTLLQFVGREHTGWLGDRPLAVHPLRLDRVQPRALARQAAGDDAYTLAGAFHLTVMGTYPAAHVLALVPRGVIPD